MQKPERLIGFVEVEGTNFPFEFDEKTFTLNLYPPSFEVQDKKRCGFFEAMNNPAKNVFEWTPHKRICGVSFGGKANTDGIVFSNKSHYILFDVLDMEANYNGFISYRVNWYFLYPEGIQPFEISAFRLSGSTINYFYNPEIALQRKVEFAENGTGLTGFSVSSADMHCSADCGEYPLTDDISAKITVHAYATMHYQTASNPIDATSVFTTTFSRPLRHDEIDILIKAYEYSRLFFHYISYRRNIGLYDVDVCFLNKSNQQEYNGLLVFKRQAQEETYEKANQRILDYAVIGIHSAKLFSVIESNAFGYEHICETIGDTHTYSLNRAFMILSEFEREFRNIYGQDCIRSQEYQDVKRDILNMIDGIISASKGKRRSAAKEFRKYVEVHGVSIKLKLIHALNDCRLIMLPFVRTEYQGKFGEFEEVVKGIGARMGEMRNGLAHSKLSLQFGSVNISDLKIVEKLLYAMRLKTILHDTTIIQKGINNLFGGSVAL